MPLHDDALAPCAPPNAHSMTRRYGGLSAQERSALRRQRLLDAAVQVFGTLGLRRATMRDICNEARLTERYFSEHFGSVTDAYEASFKLISEQALLATGTAMAVAPMNTIDLARAGLRAFLGFIQDDPRRAQIMLIDASSYWRHVAIEANPELNRQAMAMRAFSKQIYPDLPAHINLKLIGPPLVGAALQACLIWVQGGCRQALEEVVEHQMFVWEGLDRWFRAEIDNARLEQKKTDRG